jgi:hypothetical protein
VWPSTPARRQSGPTWRALRLDAKKQFPKPAGLGEATPGGTRLNGRTARDQQRDGGLAKVHRHGPLHLSWRTTLPVGATRGCSRHLGRHRDDSFEGVRRKIAGQDRVWIKTARPDDHSVQQPAPGLLRGRSGTGSCSRKVVSRRQGIKPSCSKTLAPDGRTNLAAQDFHPALTRS